MAAWIGRHDLAVFLTGLVTAALAVLLAASIFNTWHAGPWFGGPWAW